LAETAEIVICGAGIAGISAAYHLAVRQGGRGILLVEEGDPLSLTSDKSTECYRNWWPGPGDSMASFMNRSIDLLEELALASGNVFHLNRRGYLYLTADPRRLSALKMEAEAISALGAGELRVHSGHAQDPDYVPASLEEYAGQPVGADLFLDPGLLRRHFPYLSPQVAGGLHVRRAGWLSAQQLGVTLLESARSCGVRLRRDRLVGVDTAGGRVRGVRLEGGDRIDAPRFVNAAGPLAPAVGRMLGLELPLFSELHQKLAFKDERGAIPRSAPLLIWNDPQRLEWTEEERLWLEEDEDGRSLLSELPPGAHVRPEGGAGSPIALMLWEYRSRVIEPAWPPPFDPAFPEVVLRGLEAMLPGLRSYAGKPGRPVLDGGYYTKTRENRPLIGPLPVDGAYLIGALSGFGVMAAPAGGELLAAHLSGAPLPTYAPAFSLERYQDPAYLRQLETASSGQL
jgi:glycine/D-amino acid oxidase-like deaminating enzyme